MSERERYIEKQQQYWLNDKEWRDTVRTNIEAAILFSLFIFLAVCTNKSHNLCAVVLFKLISSRLMELAIWFSAQNVIIRGLILCANNNKHITSMHFHSKTALNFIYERFFVLLIWIFRCFFSLFCSHHTVCGFINRLPTKTKEIVLRSTIHATDSDHSSIEMLCDFQCTNHLTKDLYMRYE